MDHMFSFLSQTDPKAALTGFPLKKLFTGGVSTKTATF